MESVLDMATNSRYYFDFDIWLDGISPYNPCCWGTFADWYFNEQAILIFVAICYRFVHFSLGYGFRL